MKLSSKCLTFLLTLVSILLILNESVHSQELIDGLQSEKDKSDSIKANIMKTAENWRIAYNSNDAERLIPFYAVDACYISSHVKGLVAEGRTNLIENFRKGMSAGGHIDSLVIVSVEQSCDLRTVQFKYYATNNGVSVSGRNLLVFRKIENQWLIIIHMTVV